MEINAANLQMSIPVKIHASMCKDLQKIINEVAQLIPDIESARPGWKFGIQELCSLNNSVDKGKLLIQHCAETSKLYSVVTRDATITRCGRIQQAIKKSLIQFQCMVPDPLATQIATALDTIMDVKFSIDRNEEEAGDALLSLLRLSDANEDMEFTALKIATARLNLSSSKELLIERRCIKKLLGNFRDSEKKEKILRFLMHLIKKYAKQLNENCELRENGINTSKDSLSRTNSCEVNGNEMLGKPKDDEVQNKYFKSDCDGELYPPDAPPEEFLCPISLRLMYDPVIIASGQTYERTSIENWFREGNDTCPKTRAKLSDLRMIPNSSTRKFISQWCQDHGITIQNPCWQPSSSLVIGSDVSHSTTVSSVYNVSAALLYGEAAQYLFRSDYSNVSVVSSDASFCSNVSNSKIAEKSSSASSQMFSWSNDYMKFQSFADFGYDLYLKFLFDLSGLPPLLHRKALEDVMRIFSHDIDCSHTMLYNGFTEATLGFLKDVCDSSNIIAQKTGLQILLAVLSNFSFKIQFVSDDMVRVLSSFLNSTLKQEALALMQVLCHHPHGKSVIVSSGICSSIIDILQYEDPEFTGFAVKILSEISSVASIMSLILSSGCISKLALVLRDEQHAGYCLKVLVDLCDTNEGGEAIAKTDGCIPNIAELLDSESLEEQADATAILLSMCSNCRDNCSLVMNEGVIPALVDISVNGNARGKRDAIQLLKILRDRTRNDQIDSVVDPAVVVNDLLPKSINQLTEKRPSSKRTGFFPENYDAFLKIKILACLFQAAGGDND